MEDVGDHRRSPNGAESTAFNGAPGRGRSDLAAFRKHALLPPDDCLYALLQTIPRLTAHPCAGACSGMASAACPR